MTRTVNLSNMQFRYQLVFFVHTYGYVWLAEGCLWHLLPRQNLQWHLLPGQNMLWQYLLTGGMILLIQRYPPHFDFGNSKKKNSNIGKV